MQCDGGTSRRSAPKSRAVCVDGLGMIPAGCSITVAELEACFNAVATSSCAHEAPPACTRLNQPECGSATTMTTTTGDDAGTGTSSCSYECSGACTCASGTHIGSACQKTDAARSDYCSALCCGR